MDEATTARFFLAVAARFSFVPVFGCANGSFDGTCADATIRTLPPTSRAATYEPSSVSVRTSRSCFGSETLISARTDCAGWKGAIRAAIAGSGSIQ